MTRRSILAVLLLTLALAVACAKEDTSSDGEVAGPPAPTVAPTPAPTKPTVEIPGGPPPTQLVVEDIIVGTGKEAKTGDTVSVHYVGVSWSTKTEFDASYGRGQPITFQLGTGQVIQGWDQGVPGMREGGRRRLTIPPNLAYGERGSGSGRIGPNETLVFVVDLVKVG